MTRPPAPDPDPVTISLRDKTGDLFRAALSAVDPLRLVMSSLADLPTPLVRAFRTRRGQLCIVSVGKAALSMAAGAEDALPQPAAPPGKLARGFVPPPTPIGLVVTKEGAAGTAPRGLEVRYAGHPLPDARSVEGGADIIETLAGLERDDLAVVLLSGGTSSLILCPVDGVSLADVQETTRRLQEKGAPIHAMNTVRKHLSLTAGGRLAAAAAPATLLTFVISDVPGNRLDTIGSGPTVPDRSTAEDALKVLDRAGIRAEVPRSVVSHLERALEGRAHDTRKLGDPVFQRSRTILVGTSRTALEAAARRAREIGYRPFILEDELQGEAREVGRALGAKLKELASAGRGPLALIAGGETTVKVTGNGRGGRNQELAIGAALALEGCRGVTLLAAGTDGEDGETDAAGALVDGYTVQAARAAGVDLKAALEKNDSYPALERTGALLKTGPTGTNVMDIAIGLVA